MRVCACVCVCVRVCVCACACLCVDERWREAHLLAIYPLEHVMHLVETLPVSIKLSTRHDNLLQIVHRCEVIYYKKEACRSARVLFMYVFFPSLFL